MSFLSSFRWLGRYIGYLLCLELAVCRKDIRDKVLVSHRIDNLMDNLLEESGLTLTGSNELESSFLVII